MKLLMLMLFLWSSMTLAAEVGEKMKAECEKIISVERSAEVDSTDSSDQDGDSEEPSANGQ